MQHLEAAANKVVEIVTLDTGVSKLVTVAISCVVPASDVPDSFFCEVTIEEMLDSPKKIYGADPFQALLLAIRFVEQLLTSGRKNFEVRTVDGQKYTTPFSF